MFCSSSHPINNCSCLLLWSSLCNTWVFSDFSWHIRICWDLSGLTSLLTSWRMDLFLIGFAGDLKLGRTVDTRKGRIAIQRTCMVWRTGPRGTWRNAIPCTEEGRSPCSGAHKDGLAGAWCFAVKALGVLAASKLNTSQQRALAAEKVNSVLGCIKHSRRPKDWGKLLSPPSQRSLDHTWNTGHSFGTSNMKNTAVKWSEFSKRPPRWLEAEAISLWGEAEAAELDQPGEEVTLGWPTGKLAGRRSQALYCGGRLEMLGKS